MGRAFFHDRRGEWVWTTFLLLVVLSAQGLHSQTVWLISTYMALFIVWVWIPPRHRTLRLSLVFTGLSVAGLIIASRFSGYRYISTLLILPFAGVLGARGTKSRWPLLAMTGLAMVRIFMVPFNAGEIAPDTLAIFGIYWGVYAGRVRAESGDLDRQRMQELQTTYQELKETHQQLVETTQAVVESRSRAARLETLSDIHDGVGHRLTSLIVGLESLEMMLPDDAITASEVLPDLVATTRDALQEVRAAVRARDGTPEGDWDIKTLIRNASQRGHLTTEVEWCVDPKGLPMALQRTLYHVLQESLTNILRHSAASTVAVALAYHRDGLIFTVSDDGQLTRVGDQGFGIAHLKQRCDALGGSLQLRVNEPHGLIVEARLPYSKEATPDADENLCGR